MDPLTEFLEAKCFERPEAVTTGKDLWAAYETWAKDTGERYPLGRKTFSQELARRFLPDKGTKGVRVLKGVGLGTPPTPPPSPPEGPTEGQPDSPDQIDGGTSEVPPKADFLQLLQAQSHVGNIPKQVPPSATPIQPIPGASATPYLEASATPSEGQPSPPAQPPDPCSCGGTTWWWRALGPWGAGEWVCSFCHPQPLGGAQ